MTGLFVWVVIAAAGYSGGIRQAYGWQELAVFSTPAACTAAINQLGIKQDTARCISK
jgi:hypothetical protein